MPDEWQLVQTAEIFLTVRLQAEKQGDINETHIYNFIHTVNDRSYRKSPS